MSFRHSIKEVFQGILRRYGFDIIPSAVVLDWQQDELALQRGEVYLPPGADQELSKQNPNLLALEQRYQEYGSYPHDQVLLWTTDLISPEDMLNFRSHNAYVYQEGRYNRHYFGYLLAYYYVKSIDRWDLLDVLEEDGAFGAVSYGIDNRYVSRDLLDSILEIYFLDDHLQITQKDHLSVLDIGAGYGRLAHRMVNALPNLSQYLCADAVPISTFLADYYLTFREIGDKARSVPLDQIAETISPGSIDLAISIHSFSECALPAIRWWIALLAEKDVPALAIVPNSRTGLLTNDGHDFGPLLAEFGYQHTATQPKYQDPVVQKYALNPDYFHLYTR